MRIVQSNIIRRAYGLAKKGFDVKYINSFLSQKIDGHITHSGVQKGIDVFSAGQPKVIFGGRKNFIRRCKNLISNEEWKELRILPLYSIGQANCEGNRRFRLDYETRILTYKDKQQ